MSTQATSKDIIGRGFALIFADRIGVSPRRSASRFMTTRRHVRLPAVPLEGTQHKTLAFEARVV